MHHSEHSCFLLVTALAWPIVVLIVVVLLRRQLTLLLPELTHLRYKDFEIEFKKKIDHLKQEAQKANLPELEQATEHPPKEVPNVSRIYYDLMNLAEMYPRGAVLEAWGVVDVAAKNALARAGIQTHPDITPTFITMRKVAELLQTREGMDRNIAQIMNELRQLRNRVAHASEVGISTGRAKEYAGLALRVASTLGCSCRGRKFKQQMQLTRPGRRVKTTYFTNERKSVGLGVL